jgi:hypothetical protein
LFAGTASLLFAVLLGRPTNLASWQGTCAVAAAAALVLWRLLWRPCFDEDLDCHKGSPGFSTLSVDSLDWFIDLILLVFWEQNSSWHSVDFTLCTFDRFVFFGFAAILLAPHHCWTTRPLVRVFWVASWHTLFVWFASFSLSTRSSTHFEINQTENIH